METRKVIGCTAVIEDLDIVFYIVSTDSSGEKDAYGHTKHVRNLKMLKTQNATFIFISHYAKIMAKEMKLLSMMKLLTRSLLTKIKQKLFKEK